MMKRVLSVLFSLLAVSALVRAEGRFEVYDFDSFKLHVYCTGDVMADASFIVEGKDSLVTLEPPLFKENAAEFESYVARLAKPVAKSVFDYHLGSVQSPNVVMPEGMPAFVKGEVYDGMMQGFARQFGDAMVEIYDGDASEVPFGKTQNWAGVSFEFRRGASSDFPGASILIGGKVYYTHWTPSEAHVSHLQISSAEGIDAEIAEAENSLASGAQLFVGGHGCAAGRDAVEFKISYLKKMKELLAASQTAQSFVEAMKEAYPDLPGAAGLDELGKAFFK